MCLGRVTPSRSRVRPPTGDSAPYSCDAMSRTTSTLVQGVLRLGSEGGDYDDVENPSLDPYIDAASSIVDDVAECATNKGITLSSTKLEIIERWLAAHAYAMSDQTLKMEKTGDAVSQYQGTTGMYLTATKYGQMAVSLDSSGCLAALGNNKRAGAFWMGLAPSAQTDYEDRD